MNHLAWIPSLSDDFNISFPWSWFINNFLVLQLPGVELLTTYNFRFGRSPLIEMPLAINPTGCARSEPKMRTHFKRPHGTLHSQSSGTMSRSLPTSLAPGDLNSPYMKQFVHSKSQQYRRLKTEWRNNVYLRRSGIQVSDLWILFYPLFLTLTPTPIPPYPSLLHHPTPSHIHFSPSPFLSSFWTKTFSIPTFF